MLLEALALAVPVIATGSAVDGSGVIGEDVVERVAADSVPELATALRRHLEHPERLRAAAQVGAAAVRAHALEGAAGEYLRILETSVVRRRE